MESFEDRIVAALCTSNIVNSHIQEILNRSDGLVVVLKVPEVDVEVVKEKLCAKVRDFATESEVPFSAVTQAFNVTGNDYLVLLLKERSPEE